MQVFYKYNKAKIFIELKTRRLYQSKLKKKVVGSA